MPKFLPQVSSSIYEGRRFITPSDIAAANEQSGFRFFVTPVTGTDAAWGFMAQEAAEKRRDELNKSTAVNGPYYTIIEIIQYVEGKAA